MLFRGKADIIENGQGLIRSADHIFPLPSVIRLVYLVKRPYHQRRLSRLEVLNRDRYICQYCGRATRELTLDHITPRHRAGEHSWENVVSACIPCNRRKAGRTPAEAGMRLIREPTAPRGDGFYIPYQLLQTHSEWKRFLPQ